MGRLKHYLEAAHKTLSALAELVELSPPSVVERDAAIKRFEFTLEACWKLAKCYLRECEGIEVNSPKSVARECLRMELLNHDQAKLVLAMIDARNLTTYTYYEDFVDATYQNLADFYQQLRAWVQAIETKVKE